MEEETSVNVVEETKPTLDSEKAESNVVGVSETKSMVSAQSVQSDADAQIAQLRAELRKSQIKASLGEQHLVPQNAELVSRLINEEVDKNGGDVDKAIADLFKSNSFLFRAPKQDPEIAKRKETEARESAQRDFNKRLIDGAIARIRRSPITIK